MNNIYNKIEQGVKKAMGILSIDRMPTVQELRSIKMRELEYAISKNGGFPHWARKLDIPEKQKTTKWTDELIEEEIESVMNVLGISRMPSRNEIEQVKQNGALHNKICKSLGYRGWAEKLGLELKESETEFGQSNEDIVESLLKENGFFVERMTTKHPFDLLVNDNIKVDVKSGRAYDLRGSRCHTFGINKKYASCDIYVIMAFNEDGSKLERTFVIPSNKLRITTLSVGENSIYNKYIDRWDYFDIYDQFYKHIV